MAANPLVDGPDVIHFRTLQDIVTDRLRSSILRGQIEPGARLQHDELARQFGVSRMPVREALRALHSEGLVELRPHRGAVVVNLLADDVAEIFGIRVMLEAKAAQLAAPRLTDSDLDHLRDVLVRMSACEDSGDSERWRSLNTEFHLSIYSACGWPRLCALIEAHRNVVAPYHRLAHSVLHRRASSPAEHAAILRAAEARDGPLLARLTVEHLQRTASGLVAYLSSRRVGRAEPGAGNGQSPRGRVTLTGPAPSGRG